MEKFVTLLIPALVALVLVRLLLPLGAYQKKRVREMAAEMGLRVAGKPDSRENCFIRGQTYAEWLESRAAMPGPGAARLGDEVIGMHEGIHHYTVGQRWLELWHERRLYVSAIHAESNELELCLWDELFRREFDIANLSFVNGSAPGNEFRAAVRVRHTRWETPACTVVLTEHGAHVVTDEPVRAPAPGQAAAQAPQWGQAATAPPVGGRGASVTMAPMNTQEP